MPTPRSVAGLLNNEGILGGSAGDADRGVIDRWRRRFSDATNALDQCDSDHLLSAGGRPALLVYRVVCTDEEALNWKVDDIGNLRVALNALVRGGLNCCKGPGRKELGQGSLRLPLATTCSAPSGNGRCSLTASAVGAVSHVSISARVVSITGIAFG